jgi:3-methyladenine DNA glycosylase AlkC
VLASAESRRGARSYAEVDRSVIELLEEGAIESRTHVEQMSIDMGRLLVASFPALAKQADRVRQAGFLTRMRYAAMVLGESFDEDAIKMAAKSKSDTVRGWGAFVVGCMTEAGLQERLDLIRPFACDPHFAVREWAWLSIRPTVISNPREAIEHLNTWVLDSADYARRFATEVTRPRGVWCPHFQLLKDSPWLARDLLDAVATDPSRYVQDSAGNWLNDASKTRASWVLGVCKDWELLDPSKTAYVRRRALRTLASAQRGK